MTTAGHAGPIPFAADAACTRAPSRKSSVRTCASGGEAPGADVRRRRQRPALPANGIRSVRQAPAEPE